MPITQPWEKKEEDQNYMDKHTMPITQPWEKKEEDQNYMDKHTISYYSKSDGKRLKRPYDPSTDMQYEFTAKSTGNLCKRYWDVSKNGWRTAKSRWKISPIKKKGKI